MFEFKGVRELFQEPIPGGVVTLTLTNLKSMLTPFVAGTLKDEASCFIVQNSPHSKRILPFWKVGASLKAIEFLGIQCCRRMD